VEVCFNNHWGTVCHDGWGIPEATVVCRQLGYSENDSIPIIFGDFGFGDGLILLANLGCSGSEGSLVECPHRGVGTHFCTHFEDAGVVCQDPLYTCEDGDIRLVNGSTSNEGRLEICFINHWGTVCDDLFTSQDASVVCRQLGFEPEGAIAFPFALFGPGRGIIFLDDTECLGNETRLDQCGHFNDQIGDSNCFHFEDVSILCASNETVCKNGDIRLAGGRGNYSGRVEVCFNDKWGTVCDDSWGASDAEVACRQLGFDPEGSVALSNAYFGEGTGPVFLDDAACTLENHTSLIECFTSGDTEIGQHNCLHSEDASVICPYCESCNCSSGDIRLVDGANDYEGRVEVCIDGVWGTICESLWSGADASVVCKQLGYSPTDAMSFDGDVFGPGEGEIFLDSFRCLGDEDFLLDCFHRSVDDERCSHAHDVGVRCSISVCSDGDVRLVGGQYDSEGRVEICFDGQFGTICDDTWDAADAIVVCRQLGYSDGEGAIALPFAFFGPGTRSIAIDRLDCTGIEDMLTECDYATDSTFCFHIEDASVLCQSENVSCANGDIRLAGTGDVHQGRLEVCFNGNWGSVCEDGWTTTDAQTVCSLLDFNSEYAISTYGGYFGQVDGPIFLDEVNCTGGETSILECLSVSAGTHDCRHFQDVGVICPVFNTTYSCQSGDLRLVGGDVDYEGRVELCINGVWGTVCDDFWDDADAAVVCNKVGYGPENATALRNAFFGRGTGPIYLDNVRCEGTEANLFQCDSIGVGSFCSHFEDAGVKCKAPLCNDGDVRLINGDLPSEGTIQLCQDEAWGTVCDDFWDALDASVVCRQLGYEAEGAIALRGAHFGQGEGRILVDDLHCVGNESSLLECPYVEPFCFHFEDAGVICPLPEDHNASCANGDVRLVGGNSRYQGRVELCLHGRWGTVCDDSWDGRDAQVVCNQLGMNSSGHAYGAGGAQFGSGSGLIFLDDVDCEGDEDTLLECGGQGVGLHNCNPSEDAGVYCPDPTAPCVNGDIRLIGGTTVYEGRVEVCLAGEWGTVCAGFLWSDEAAQVICRQKGFPFENAIAVGFAAFGEGTGPVLLTGVNCNGTEENILVCPTFSSFFFIPFICQGHSRDAGVVCDSPDVVCDDGDIRLAGGAVPSEGRVEVCLNNHWGTVCDDFWTNEDAMVVCRQLDLPPEGALAISRGYFGIGFGRIHLDDLLCDGTEDALINCTHDGPLNHNCVHAEDAGVICIVPNPLCETGGLRLISTVDEGEEQLQGTLEICFGGNWGTICDDLWDNTDASVACRQLGFYDIGAIAYSRARYGQGTGPIFLDDMRCFGNETRIEHCRSSQIAAHNCGHAEDAGVTCRPIPCVDGTLRLIEGYSLLHGRLEICIDEEWSTVCGSGFTDEMAGIACAAMNNSQDGAFRSAEGLFAHSPTSRAIYTLTVCDDEDNCTFNATAAPSSCSHANDVGVFCMEENFTVCATGAMRLAGSLDDNEGRVEVCVNNQWGTVCDDSWDERGANLMCRALFNMPLSGETVSADSYGDASGIPILLDDVKCTGSESNLLSCPQLPRSSAHDCTHTEDVAVRCLEISECSEGEVRLVGGSVESEGRVEMCVHGRWGTVCADSSWDDTDAQTVCTQLGFQGGEAVGGSYFGMGSGDLFFSQFSCSESNTRLRECSFEAVQSQFCSTHSNDAGVICTVSNVTCTDGDVRLSGGANKFSGRVETCSKNKWIGICYDNWGDAEATVVCRQLNFPINGARATPQGFYENIYGDAVTSGTINCGRDEESLDRCPKDDQDGACAGSVAGVVCQSTSQECTDGALQLVGGKNNRAGRVQVCMGGTWGTVCDSTSAWGTTQASVVCQNLGFSGNGTIVSDDLYAGVVGGPVFLDNTMCSGTESSLLKCNNTAAGSTCRGHMGDVGVACQAIECTEGAVRLVGGESKYDGRVEVCINKVWGTVCARGATSSDAQTVCKRRGFSGEGAILTGGGFFGKGSGTIYGSLGGSGSVDSCTHDDDIGVLCGAQSYSNCANGEVRLASPSSDGKSGRVEVCYNDEWGTVCSDNWDDDDATVVCRQLNLDSQGATAQTVGGGSGRILLSNIKCSGDEPHLLTCVQSPLGIISHCSHDDDAGVTCSNEKPTEPTKEPTNPPTSTPEERRRKGKDNTATIVIPIVLIIILIIVIVIAVILGILYYRKRKTGKSIFTTRSQPDQLPFADSYPDSISGGGEPEKTETL
jgi:deleted-in-malignant-brain-tumors protein 1